MTKNGKNAIEWDTLSADQLINELAVTLSLSSPELKKVQAAINKLQGDRYVEAMQVLSIRSTAIDTANSRSSSSYQNQLK
ncbi:MAG: hypothetical protein QF741_02180 [Candidatus Peribacteraceae bacterium]|nr:hypothetical protein [Candidatus Peribacteraceae bacterium]MDP7454711.1 hypothetical protein [Candidatus Peribacteraceae bacterium]